MQLQQTMPGRRHIEICKGLSGQTKAAVQGQLGLHAYMSCQLGIRQAASGGPNFNKDLSWWVVPFGGQTRLRITFGFDVGVYDGLDLIGRLKNRVHLSVYFQSSRLQRRAADQKPGQPNQALVNRALPRRKLLLPFPLKHHLTVLLRFITRFQP